MSCYTQYINETFSFLPNMELLILFVQFPLPVLEVRMSAQLSTGASALSLMQ